MNNLKDKIQMWYKNYNWEQAGHKTAFILIKIGNFIKGAAQYLPLLLLLFFFVQLCLGISRGLLPFFPWFEWGWNDEFLNKFPYIMQPHGYPWASICITSSSILLFLLMAYIKDFFDNENISKILMNVYAVITIVYFACLFLIPEKVIEYAGIGGWVVIGLYILWSLINGGSSGGGGGCCSNDEDDEEDYSSTKTQKYTPEYVPDKIEYKFTDVRQYGNQVLIKSSKFVNGKQETCANGFSKHGILQNWNENQVTILEGKWYTSYGPRNERLRSWMDINHK